MLLYKILDKTYVILPTVLSWLYIGFLHVELYIFNDTVAIKLWRTKSNEEHRFGLFSLLE